MDLRRPSVRSAGRTPFSARKDKGGVLGRIYSGRHKACHLPGAAKRGRGEGRVPRRGTSVPPANLFVTRDAQHDEERGAEEDQP